MGVITTQAQVTENDRAAMVHFFSLWKEFNASLDHTITSQPIPLRERVHMFGTYAQGWGRDGY